MKRVKRFFARLTASHSSTTNKPATSASPLTPSTSSVSLASLAPSRVLCAPPSDAPETITEDLRSHVYLSERRALPGRSALPRDSIRAVNADQSLPVPVAFPLDVAPPVVLPRRIDRSDHQSNSGPHSTFTSTSFPPLTRPSSTVYPTSTFVRDTAYPVPNCAAPTTDVAFRPRFPDAPSSALDRQHSADHQTTQVRFHKTGGETVASRREPVASHRESIASETVASHRESIASHIRRAQASLPVDVPRKHYRTLDHNRVYESECQRTGWNDIGRSDHDVAIESAAKWRDSVRSHANASEDDGDDTASNEGDEDDADDDDRSDGSESYYRDEDCKRRGSSKKHSFSNGGGGGSEAGRDSVHDAGDSFIHWEIRRVLQAINLRQWYMAQRVREPLWVDVCVLHRKCARILSGAVVTQTCVRGVDCRSHYHLVDYNDGVTHALTWRDVAKHRQRELEQLKTLKPRGTSLLSRQLTTR
jgi:hypothetical protein